MKANKYFLILTILLLTASHGSSQCNVVKVDARNSTIYVNCGGSQRIIKGQIQIIEFLSEINTKTETLIDMIGKKRDNDEDVAAEIKEIKEYMTIVLIVSNQIKNLQENANKITKGAVERLLFRGFFFEACSILDENKNQSDFSELKKKACRLNNFLENSEIYLDRNNFVLALRYTDSIKVVGGQSVSYNFTKKVSETIKNEFQEIAQTDIISRFDDINCPTCLIQKTKGIGYLEIYDKFQLIYNFDPNGFSNWYDKDLKWFVKYFNDAELKGIHSEVLYKICFMFNHDFSDINKKKVKFTRYWLSNLINLSIEVNYRQNDLNKKLDLRRSING